MNYLQRLKDKGFTIYSQIDNSNWYLRDSKDGQYNGHSNVVCLISPHSGTDFKWLLRADYDETLDRWGVCLFEEYFSNKEEFNEVLKQLDEFIKNREDNIKEELDNFKDLIGED